MITAEPKKNPDELAVDAGSSAAASFNLEDSGQRKSARTTQRKFYLIGRPPRSRQLGIEFTNEDQVFRDGPPRILTPPGMFERGFRHYPVTPCFRISQRLGRKLNDINKFGEYWIVTQRAKDFLSQISENDFSFLKLDSEVDRGCNPVSIWLCEIMQLLDAVDEQHSEVKVTRTEDGRRWHTVTPGTNLIIDGAAVGSHHVFRLATSYTTVIGDQCFKDTISKNKITGLSFRDASRL